MPPPDRIARRSWFPHPLGATALLLSLVLLAFAVPARPALAATSIARHDRSHPIRLLASNAGRHVSPLAQPAITWLGPVPILPLAQATPRALATAFTTNPYQVCLNGVAYAQGEWDHGQLRWWIGGTYTQIIAYVVYFWCASSANPAGYNFAYTVEWYNRTYDPRWFQEFTLGQSMNLHEHVLSTAGATLERSDGRMTGDGMPMHTLSVAVNQIVADYSLPQDGQYRYKGILQVDALDVSAGPPTGAPIAFAVADPYFV